jgi:hypothetical protein
METADLDALDVGEAGPGHGKSVVGVRWMQKLQRQRG